MVEEKKRIVDKEGKVREIDQSSITGRLIFHILFAAAIISI